MALRGLPASGSFLRVVISPSSGGRELMSLSVRSRSDSLSLQRPGGRDDSLFFRTSNTERFPQVASSAGSVVSALKPAWSSTSAVHCPMAAGSSVMAFSRRSRSLRAVRWPTPGSRAPRREFCLRLRSVRDGRPQRTAPGRLHTLLACRLRRIREAEEESPSGRLEMALLQALISARSGCPAPRGGREVRPLLPHRSRTRPGSCPTSGGRDEKRLPVMSRTLRTCSSARLPGRACSSLCPRSIEVRVVS
mmetsp:Transcript_32168/g.91270  ORF Transcript_32168/g.91270 Transcript_32168/m.91270 type:complete len:249 (-) Transcript_32168:306-1052(-)